MIENKAEGTGAPEPPASYRPGPSGQQPLPGGFGQQPNEELEKARKMTRAAQIMALVSLLIGGVLLGTVALVTAVIAYRKTSGLVSANQANLPPEIAFALKRSAVAAIVVSVLALALNAIALAMIYPTLVEVMQTGDYGTLFGSGQQASPSTSGSGSSFWG